MTIPPKELLVGFGALILACILFNPMGMSMSNMELTSLVALLFVLYALFAVFSWRERAVDEREDAHRMRAARTAYLATSAVLVVGIGFEAFAHRVDPWLVAALGVTIAAKAVGSYWGRHYF